MSTTDRAPSMATLSVLAALSLGFVLSAAAGEKAVALKDTPAAVQKTITDQLKGGKLRGLSLEVENGRTQYEAELTVDGHDRDLIIDPAGKVLEVEGVVEFSALPDVVRAGLTREAGKGSIGRVEDVTREGVVSYEALIKEPGKKDREVKVGADGKVVAPRK